MTGLLVKKQNSRTVKYDRGHEVIFYDICKESKKWTEKKEVKKFIHENIEVQFNLVTKGFYDQNTETQVREFCAKLISIEHSTI